MSLAAVIEALHNAGIQPTGREIAEALWLAHHMAAPSAPTAARPRQPPSDKNDDQAAEPAPASATPTIEPVPLNSINRAAGGSRIRGHPVGIPDLPGLPRREDIQRALRPLRRYGPSPRHRVIDENATATFIANTGVWTPVMRPAPEHWFDLVLAVDSSPSMDLWRPLISDLRTVLAGTGAFRDVRTWRLRPQQEAMILPPDSRGPARSHRELIDGTGRRLFFVVTDGAARGWHNGSAASVLTDWSKTGPVAVLQPLPEEMWTRTGLAVVPARLSANAPGTPNSQLRVDYRRRPRISGIPIPVLGIEPNSLYSWAKLIAGSASGVPLAATMVNGNRPILSPSTDENESGNGMDGFRASASPQAYQLAVFLSAVPLTLPIMRLVQHVALPMSNPSALAEVILGGLISRTGDNTYEFLPGIREALLGELRRSELATVLSAVSDYIAQHAGSASQTFAAIAQRADGPVTADAEAFSWVPPAVAVRLGLPDVSRQHHKDQIRDRTIPPNDDQHNKQPTTGAALNSAFRKAVAADRQLVSGGSKQSRGRRGPYDGGYLSLPHLAHLVANRLADIDSQHSWPESEVEEILSTRGDRALPSEPRKRQVFLEAVQQELDKCFEAERAKRHDFRAQPQDYVSMFLGIKSSPTAFRLFDFDPASIGFFKIVDWNRSRRLDPVNAGRVQIVEWADVQDWINEGDFRPYLERAARVSRGSPYPSLLGYDVDTRKEFNTELILKVKESAYYRHVAVREYLRDHHEVYDSLLRRIYDLDGEGGLEGLIRRAPISNITINVTVMDREGDVILIKRSLGMRSWGGFFQAGPHEAMIWPQPGQEAENCFELARRALAEELGLTGEHYDRIVFSWFGYYLVEPSAYFVAHITTRLTKSQLIRLTQEAPGSSETDDVAWLTPTEKNIQSVVETWQDGPWSPRHDAAGRRFLPHTVISLTQLRRVLDQGMLPD